MPVWCGLCVGTREHTKRLTKTDRILCPSCTRRRNELVICEPCHDSPSSLFLSSLLMHGLHTSIGLKDVQIDVIEWNQLVAVRNSPELPLWKLQCLQGLDANDLWTEGFTIRMISRVLRIPTDANCSWLTKRCTISIGLTFRGKKKKN